MVPYKSYGVIVITVSLIYMLFAMFFLPGDRVSVLNNGGVLFTTVVMLIAGVRMLFITEQVECVQGLAVFNVIIAIPAVFFIVMYDYYGAIVSCTVFCAFVVNTEFARIKALHTLLASVVSALILLSLYYSWYINNAALAFMN